MFILKTQRNLIDAIKNGKDVKISRLIQLGTHVNQPDWYDKTPLHYAAENNADKAIAALIAASAKRNMKNQHNQTAKEFAFKEEARHVFDEAEKKHAAITIQKLHRGFSSRKKSKILTNTCN